jgi:hypothetical protein
MPLTPQDFVSQWKRDLRDEEILAKSLALAPLARLHCAARKRKCSKSRAQVPGSVASAVLRKFGEGKVMSILGEVVFIMIMSLGKDRESVIITVCMFRVLI